MLANQRRGERRGESEIVRLALARLSDRDRETVMLIAWEGLSGARAAAVGCSVTAFKVRLHRARGRLAAALRELDDAPPARRPESMEASR